MFKKRFFTITLLIISILLFITYGYLSFEYYEVSLYNIEISADVTNITLSQNESKAIQVSLKNNSRSLLSHEDRYYLSYHVYSQNGDMIQFDNDRTSFGYLQPKGIINDIPFEIKSIQDQGIYIYKIDIVKEGVAWYSENNNPTFDIIVEII